LQFGFGWKSLKKIGIGLVYVSHCKYGILVLRGEEMQFLGEKMQIIERYEV
jgi:hypothetical protein